ncbi:phosphotransferase family protein [Pseudophaeobacter arcticus]|jgi:thiamine kinase|uniref:phosphotransferase family protein n=1 Tax=Pseudophaeobacter arcticus TaxID=385492 RepID=UPI0039E7163C
MDFDQRFFRSLKAQGLDVAAPLPFRGGRSNRVWRCGDRVVKLYLRHRDNPLFANDPAREVAALAALSGTGMVPSLLGSGRFEGHNWLIYGHITGAPWQQDSGHVAQLLGRLHDQPEFSGLPRGVNGSAALEAQVEVILNRCTTDLDRVAQLRQLRPIGQVPALSQLALIHGDPVPGNLLAHDGTLTLIDWQCPQMGDPSEDLALFLSPAMQVLYRGGVLSATEVEAFLAAYPDPRVVGRYLSLKPWFHWRMAGYCLWRCADGNPLDQQGYELELAAMDQSSIPNTA